MGFSLIGTIYISVRNNSRKHSINHLRLKESQLKDKLRNIYIDQIGALNVMLINGAIKDNMYIKIIGEICINCKNYDIDTSFVSLLIKNKGVDINSKIESVLTLANQLMEQNKITDAEFEYHVDIALDNMKRDK